MSPIVIRLVRSAVLATLAVASTSAFAVDPVVFRFATVGDSREDIQESKFDASSRLASAGTSNGKAIVQDVTWGQNTKAFARILRTAQSQKANLFFENGDMIMGYGRSALPTSLAGNAGDYIRKSDVGLAYVEYAYWRGLVSPFIDQGMYVVPVPGNHETQCSASSNGHLLVTGGTTCATGKWAYTENEDAWRANMGDLIADIKNNQRFQVVSGVAATNTAGTQPIGATETTYAPAAATNGPSVTTTSQPGGSQQQLTYSFDVQTPNGGPLVHFAVINTDPSGNDGVAPTAWLSADFAAAQARGATKYFVFGHKAAFTYQYVPGVTAADLSTNTTERNSFWQLVSQYNATYFCGHEHTYNVAQYADPTNTYTAKTPYQVLVGSGGSPFEMTSLASGEPLTDRYYAWALVEVHQSGAVTMNTYGFNENFGPTQVILNGTVIQ